jgi:hypothetical protein
MVLHFLGILDFNVIKTFKLYVYLYWQPEVYLNHLDRGCLGELVSLLP